jgi:NAD(P)-dependent dehydrogenase (short-subunit alcohol dehydrogenase family)
MGFCGVIVKLGAFLVAFLAILVGGLVANVPGQVGLWRYLDSYPRFRGGIPAFHEGTPWNFNHSTLGPQALKGRTFLVTGANIGLGYATVHYFAVHGGNVILGCRALKNCEEAVREIKRDAPTATLIPLVLDLSSFQSIKQFSEEVKKSTQQLHSVILNAGIAHYPFGLTEDGLEQQIGVNHFGHAYLVQLLEDLLKQSASRQLPGTIVVVSSGSHFSSYPEGVKLSLSAMNDPSEYNEALAYGQSKLANVLYAQQQADRLKPYNILVNVVHPGLVETNITLHVFHRFQEKYPVLADVLIRCGVASKFKALMSRLAWNPKDAALTQIYPAVSPEVLSNHVTGKYYHPIARETLPDRTHATNVTLQQRLWSLTEEVLKAKAK